MQKVIFTKNGMKNGISYKLCMDTPYYLNLDVVVSRVNHQNQMAALKSVTFLIQLILHYENSQNRFQTIFRNLYIVLSLMTKFHIRSKSGTPNEISTRT